MNNNSGLKQCNRVLLVTTLLILASSLQLEINSHAPVLWVWIHIVTGILFLSLICRHIYLHFRWNNWIMRLIRKRRGVVRWMTVSGLLLILSACIATIHWTATTAHTVVGAIHGKIGFIFILLTIIHIIRYRRFFIRQSRHK